MLGGDRVTRKLGTHRGLWVTRVRTRDSLSGTETQAGEQGNFADKNW